MLSKESVLNFRTKRPFFVARKKRKNREEGNAHMSNTETKQDGKEDTTKEIVTIFKNKEMFKGYNLANKK